jgi:hypothetical protein
VKRAKGKRERGKGKGDSDPNSKLYGKEAKVLKLKHNKVNLEVKGKIKN